MNDFEPASKGETNQSVFLPHSSNLGLVNQKRQNENVNNNYETPQSKLLSNGLGARRR